MEALAMLAGGAALLLGLCALLYYNFAAATRCRNAVSLRGKTVLITGDYLFLNLPRQIYVQTEPRLDILINNAGVMTAGHTIDGFDEAFQVNHLAHFLLTHLLLDRLKRCAPSQVIILASIMHCVGKIDFQTIHKPGKGLWQVINSYHDSKLANILHTRELANRLEGTNVTCYAVHPGFVLTEMTHFYPPWMIWILKPFLQDTNTGAQTTIFCATEEGIERLSGQYFADCRPKVPWPQARDDQMAELFWEFSEMLLGLTTPHGKGQGQSLG
ncbi:dehydrogenase/reductase SDR family member 13-like [Crotalus tigris]|uniref:dehydrogenase/reductase SDR family member 13-like n=1 Tax=Crotalus tigris TaxID=88082 RepID=UPI00192F478C|nr:dehydrogenase/reductase SDR family member 13-like [Crotalus tigris]